MQQGVQSGSAFVLLYGESARVVPLERQDKSTVIADLGDQQWHVGFDHRDQRTLLIFDGAIPPQGLPRAAHAETLAGYLYKKPKENTRSEGRKEEWSMPPNLRLNPSGHYELLVRRFAILAPASELLLCRFRPENFGLQYVFTEVRRQVKCSQVTWRFHSP